jgi:hypothetical protein
MVDEIIFREPIVKISNNDVTTLMDLDSYWVITRYYRYMYIDIYLVQWRERERERVIESLCYQINSK